jgi:hypothetical protein
LRRRLDLQFFGGARLGERKRVHALILQ